MTDTGKPLVPEKEDALGGRLPLADPTTYLTRNNPGFSPATMRACNGAGKTVIDEIEWT